MIFNNKILHDKLSYNIKIKLRKTRSSTIHYMFMVYQNEQMKKKISFIKLIKLKIVKFTSTLDEKTLGGMTKGLEMMTPLKYSGFSRAANKAAAPP